MRKDIRRHQSDRPDGSFGDQRFSRRTFNTDHPTTTNLHGENICQCCTTRRNVEKAEARERSRNEPDWKGRDMARGDEWRYAHIGARADDGRKMRKDQISREAPDWMTRTSTTVHPTNHGSSHPFEQQQRPDHTHRIRAASASAVAFVGGRRRFSKGVGKQSSDSPFPDPTEPEPEAKAPKMVLKNGKYVKAGPKKKAHVMRTPFATSKIHHTSEFNKPSTAKTNRPGVGYRQTNTFYNSTGGWAASGR